MISDRFQFGQNWQDFISRYFNPDREQLACASLTSFLKLPHFEGLSFLDIGCGSGLFSLAALRLGANRIVSFDVDPLSVECAKRLKEYVGSPAHWMVLEGSVLDQDFLARLQQADIVYAWGCLHHTGEMWNTIRNVASLVAANGLLCLAIYNWVDGRRGSEFWFKVKRHYNRSAQIVQRLMEFSFTSLNAVVLPLLRFQNPFTYIQSFSGGRGMNLRIDLKDWLGGYPYEFASAHEVFRLLHDELEFELENLKVVNDLGNNEFVFRRGANAVPRTRPFVSDP